jgi:hypothetical protein
MSSKKQKPNGQQATTPPSNNCIPYEDAVVEAKRIIKTMDDQQMRLGELQMRLGELANRVETKYRDRTLAKFAKEIGYPACTLKRHLSVYRAWDGKKAPGPVSYAVLRELQNHPDREAILKENPKITKREAQEKMRKWKQQHEGKQEKGKSSDWKAEGNKRWLRRLCSFANEHGRTAEELMGNKEMMDALREIAEPQLAAALGSDLEVLLRLAKLLAHRDGHIAKAERKRPHLKEAAREGVSA